jgi:hypothetical protein
MFGLCCLSGLLLGLLLAFQQKFSCCLTLKARIHGILPWLRLSSTSGRDGLGDKGISIDVSIDGVDGLKAQQQHKPFPGQLPSGQVWLA